MDDLFVHKSRILRLKVPRRILRQVSRVCATSVVACRERQLLSHQSVLTWGALAGLVGMAGRHFEKAAHWGPAFSRDRHRAAVKTPAARRFAGGDGGR